MFSEEYLRKEQEFMDRRDALCEYVPPTLCDCSACPTRDLCKWLEDNNPLIHVERRLNHNAAGIPGLPGNHRAAQPSIP